VHFADISPRVDDTDDDDIADESGTTADKISMKG